MKMITIAEPVSSDPALNLEAMKIASKSGLAVIAPKDKKPKTNEPMPAPLQPGEELEKPEGELGVQNMAALILMLCVIVKIISSNIPTAVTIWSVLWSPLKYWTAIKNIVKAAQDIADRAPQAWEEIKDFKVMHETDDLLRLLVDGLGKVLALNTDYSGETKK